MKNMAMIQQITHLNEKIYRLVSSQGVLVNQDTSFDLVTMMKESGEAAQKE